MLRPNVPSQKGHRLDTGGPFLLPGRVSTTVDTSDPDSRCRQVDGDQLVTIYLAGPSPEAPDKLKAASAAIFIARQEVPM